MKSLLLNILKINFTKNTNHCKESLNNIKFTKVETVNLTSNSNYSKPINLHSANDINNKISLSTKEAIKLYKDCSWLLDSYHKGINKLTKEEIINLNTLEDHLKNKIPMSSHLNCFSSINQKSFFEMDNTNIEISEYILNNAYTCIKEYRDNINKSKQD